MRSQLEVDLGESVVGDGEEHDLGPVDDLGTIELVPEGRTVGADARVLPERPTASRRSRVVGALSDVVTRGQYSFLMTK